MKTYKKLNAAGFLDWILALLKENLVAFLKDFHANAYDGDKEGERRREDRVTKMKKKM